LQAREFENEEVAELLIRNFGIAKNQALTDAGNWIRSMVNAGLII
jgi:hypothetical protein